MNDRFRFRAWSKQLQSFIDIEKTAVLHLAEYDSDFIVEQCTGLKDKNGRLIYEGDIVKATFKYMGSKTENLCFAVAFSDGAFGYFDELGRFGLLANLGTGVMFKVVGNIHEKPELLKECK